MWLEEICSSKNTVFLLNSKVCVEKFGKISDLCIFSFHGNMQSKLEGNLTGHLVKLLRIRTTYGVSMRYLLDLMCGRI